MSPSRLLPVLALTSLLAVPVGAPAWAADITPAQASDLEGQLRAWLAGLAGPAIDVGPRPVKVTAEGDHFAITVTEPEALVQAKMLPQGLSTTLKATPLDAGRWSLDDLKVPSPLVMTLPASASPPDAKKPNVKPVPQTVTASIDSQQFHGLFDPSFATSSSFDSTLTGLHVVGANSDSSTASITSHSSFEPKGNGKIDVISEGSSTKSVTRLKDVGDMAVTYSIDSTHSQAHARTVAPAALAALIRSLTTLLPTLKDTTDSLNPDQRGLARTAVFALRDVADGADIQQTLQTIKISAGGHNASINKIGLGARVGTEDGRLKLQNEFSVEGIESAEIPPGIFREYLPRKIVIKPRVSGVPTDDLIKLMLRAIDSDAADQDQLQEAAIALLGEGPLQVAIDELTIDLGHADLAAHGSVDITGPDDISGDAQVAMNGLDALIKRANSSPEIQQIAPVLIFLKGIGQQNGNATLWNISYHDGKAMVNDTDLSAMLPGNQPEVHKKK